MAMVALSGSTVGKIVATEYIICGTRGSYVTATHTKSSLKYGYLSQESITDCANVWIWTV